MICVCGHAKIDHGDLSPENLTLGGPDACRHMLCKCRKFEAKLLPIGTKIIFEHAVVEHADGDHPEFILADRGQSGEITGYADFKDTPYIVQTSKNAGKFCVKEDEIRAAQ
jgi:hypothetical protein